MPARGERGGQRAGEKKCHVKIFLALLENLNFFPLLVMEVKYGAVKNNIA